MSFKNTNDMFVSLLQRNIHHGRLLPRRVPINNLIRCPFKNTDDILRLLMYIYYIWWYICRGIFSTVASSRGEFLIVLIIYCNNIFYPTHDIFVVCLQRNIQHGRLLARRVPVPVLPLGTDAGFHVCQPRHPASVKAGHGHWWGKLPPFQNYHFEIELCIYTQRNFFGILLIPNGRPFSSKSIGKWLIQSETLSQLRICRPLPPLTFDQPFMDDGECVI